MIVLWLTERRFSSLSYSIFQIGYVPPRTNGLWPGVFLFSTPSRMMRPVKQLKTGNTEYIGTLEQIHMDIAVKPKEVVFGQVCVCFPSFELSTMCLSSSLSDFLITASVEFFLISRSLVHLVHSSAPSFENFLIPSRPYHPYCTLSLSHLLISSRF